MALAEVLTINIGVSITKWITKAWLGDGLRAELAGGAYDLVGQRVPEFFAQRRLNRQLEQVAETSGEKLSALIEQEFRNTPDNERSAAVIAASDSLEAGIGRINLAELDFDPFRLYKELKLIDLHRVERAALSGSAARLYDLVLSESCTYIVEVALTLPQAATSAYIELLRRDTALIDLVREVYQRLPDPRALQSHSKSHLAEYETSYRRLMARKFDRLELFGLSVSELGRRYALSVAYITLSVKQRTPTAVADRSVEDDLIDETPDGDQDYLRVDEAIGRTERIFVRGPAGCGKTTLLQWLAVKAAREDFEGPLAEWNGLVPIFLPLRRLDPGNLPGPRNFLKHTSASIAEEAPEGWIDGTLRHGRALVMVDGVDEVPESARPSVRRWLEDLMDTYPDCRYVVTSRPAAVPENWLRSSEFEPMDLQPMTGSDIHAFVSHWHEAAARGVDDSEALGELEGYKIALLRSVRTNRQIRNLATTPLLCAMLCALNRDRRTHLPRDRVELYRIALETLLERRDIERQIDHTAYPQLSLPQKIILLRELAYWLMLNDQSDTDLSIAGDRIEYRLRNMPGVPDSAPEVVRYLLVRSGLLREPIPGRVDFIHRTFQEYLAAIEIAELGNIPFLISKADEDQWREVVILASGHCSVRQKELLLDGIIDRGNEEPANRHRLHLLAVACLETARELPPALADRITQCLYELLPPGNFTDARDLSSAGDLALTLLGRYARERAPIAAACVRTAALVGGDLATEVLASFGSDRRITVQKELIRAWGLAENSEEFARRVLADTPFARGSVVITDSNLLPSVHMLRGAADVRARVPGSPIDEIPPTPTLTFLDVSDSPRLRHLEHLRRSPNLKTLITSRCGSIENLDFLGESVNLGRLAIQGCSGLVDVAGLRGAPRLQYLNASFCDRVVDWTPLQALKSLTQLYLTATNITDLEPLSEMTALEIIGLEGTEITSLDPLISSARTINNLDISGCEQLQHLDAIAEMTHLSTLSCVDCAALSHMPDLKRLEALRHLNLTSCSGLVSLTSLPRNLEFLAMDHCGSLQIGRDAWELPRLDTLYLDGTTTDDLSFLEGCERLSSLTLYESSNLRSLRPLASLKQLSDLDIRGCNEGLDLRDLGDSRDESIVVFLRSDQAVQGEREFLDWGNYVNRSGSYSAI
ncbi:NACHT domain-containing protein [Micromonospora sp. NBC_00330]|uniref:NACHT N-terminal Helical domain 1-containing protein n=1 Tax=Micromonospora sp. NBC_00330 TaxID=2903585 RepID=UPI002E2C59CD|nr:NACHT domain-containing protein [Micromonospora sp. NBC_00330]